MKAILKFSIIGLAGGLGLGAFTARANLEVSAAVSVHAPADFYAPLASRGAWIEVGSYGRCWHPAGIAVDWRPYCDGQWVWTDCGWYWQSDEPWGWACYHYGCWVYDPVNGWVWVPGIEWAPAWVVWRVGGGYIGWAPLGPRGVVVAGPSFVFVESAKFQNRLRPSAVIVNNTAILGRTTVINNIKRETRNIGGAGPQQVVINQGPGLTEVQKASGRTIKAIPIHEAARRTPAPAGVAATSEVKGKDKPAFAPPEQQKTAPENKAEPAERREPGAESPPPGFQRPPASESPGLSPHSPPPQAKPPGTAPKRPEEPGANGGHEPEGGHHDKD
jgi:hypothetical protein